MCFELVTYSKKPYRDVSQLTVPTEQRPSWGANGRSAGQERLCLLWNRNINYRV